MTEREAGVERPMSQTEQNLDRLAPDARQIIDRYPQSRSALLPLLHLVQAEEGYVSDAGIEFCAAQLGLSTAEVTAVATFYTMYKRKPCGDYLVGVCTNTLCAVMGGDAILARLQRHLGIANDETTEDGAVTLEHVECNAACDYAPVVMVNWEFFDNQTPDSAVALVDELRAGKQVTPTRGAPLATFKEVERVLAGFPDPRPDAVAAGPGAGPATLAGLRVYHGEAASGERPTGASRQGRGTGVPPGRPSAHDAPSATAASDPHHPSGPAARGEAPNRRPEKGE
jgi:NADH-quinone oxidoreductase subunit E